MTKLTHVQRATIAKRYAAGDKLELIAALYKTTKNNVVMIARRRGLPPRQVQNRKKPVTVEMKK